MRGEMTSSPDRVSRYAIFMGSVDPALLCERFSNRLFRFDIGADSGALDVRFFAFCF